MSKSKLVKENLQLFTEVTVDGITDKIEFPIFDFSELDFEYIADDAQERLLNLIIKRQHTNLTIDEILSLIQVPLLKELNGRLKNG